jgi:hypothetical protein
MKRIHVLGAGSMSYALAALALSAAKASAVVDDGPIVPSTAVNANLGPLHIPRGKQKAQWKTERRGR